MTDKQKILSDLYSLIEYIHNANIDIAKYLYYIQKQKLYRPNYVLYSDFLKDIGITPSKALRLVNIYKNYVIEYKVNPQKLRNTSYSKLDTAIPLLKYKDVDEILNLIENMSRLELIEYMNRKYSHIKTRPTHTK